MDIQKKIEDYLNEGLVEEHKAQVYIDKFEQAVSSFKKNLKAMKNDSYIKELIDMSELRTRKAENLLDELENWIQDLEEEIFDEENK